MDLSGEGLGHKPRVLTHGLCWALGAVNEPALGLSTAGGTSWPDDSPGYTVIHVAPEQPIYAMCVLGTETQLDVYG